MLSPDAWANGAVQSPGKVYLVLEYCNGGDLSEYIKKHGRVSEATAQGFMQQLGAGLEVLRSHNLIHVSPPPQPSLTSEGLVGWP